MAKINRIEYDIRTLAYYQQEGGAYNDIITVLSKLRNDAKYRGLPAPAKVLNEGSYWWDVIWENWRNNNYTFSIPSGLTDPLSLCIVACIASSRADGRYYLVAELDDVYYFVETIKTVLKHDKKFYPKFQPVIDHYQNLHKSGLESLQSKVHAEKIKELNEQLRAKDEKMKKNEQLIIVLNATIAAKSQELDALKRINSVLRAKCSIAEQSKYKGSKFDRLLTLDTILEWIEGRHHYNYTEQVFRMLSDLKDKVATDEEREKIREVENRMLDKNQVQAVFNQNYALNSNMMTGMVCNPQLPIGVSPADAQPLYQQLFQQFLNQLNNGQQQG